MAAFPAPISLSSTKNEKSPLAPLDTSLHQKPHQPATKTSNISQAVAHRGPQCTHMAMARLYGDHTCMLCGRSPDLGFVYQCEQDHLADICAKKPIYEVFPLIPDHGYFFEAQAVIASSLGMSESVITQIRAGEYSREQIKTLFAQRRAVKQVISQAPPSQESKPPSKRKKKQTPKSNASPRSANNVPLSGPCMPPPQSPQSDHPVAPPPSPASPCEAANLDTSHPPAPKPTTPKCNFQVCHTCRPFFQDRLPMSFGAVLNDEVPALTEHELPRLRIRDSNVVSKLGLRQLSYTTPTGQRDERSGDGGDNGEELSQETTPSSDWTDTSDDAECAAPSPSPGTPLYPVSGSGEGSAYDQDFDHVKRVTGRCSVAGDISSPAFDDAGRPCSIQRPYNSPATSHGAPPSNASSISLPEPVTEPLTPAKPYFSSQLDFGRLRHGLVSPPPSDFGHIGPELGYLIPPFNLFGKASNSSIGSEVEVDGGVALTEEAVGTGIPDIVTEEE